ncbi:MAG: hypothetical protein CVT98_02990 [Bacteroidetes bacterium HGW-Bacteroidetes-15]|nr:MAG: hypothetical protein CVT98_02990 [Bacteroidetes bacterium HGW-Bacteroidetes-15]
MHKQLLIILLILFTTDAAGQYYSSGQEPSWVKWRMHKAAFGRVIFSDEIDSLAATFTHYMNYALEVVPKSLVHQPRKFPVIIHSNSILSNGFVSWAPKRMEIVSTPSFDASPEPWLLSLAVHETRHIVQIDKLNSGLFKLGYYIFGEQSVGAAAGLVPLWFLEGDAVFSETEHTLGGRGRQASFYQIYRTHLLSRNGSEYSYDKWLLGSYKNHIPNHYHFGYQMVGYANLKYGSKVWSNALNRVSRQPYSIFPFYFSLKKDISLSRKGLYIEAFNHLNTLWKVKEVNVYMNDVIFLIKNNIKNNHIEYKYPFLINDSTLIAFKTSLNNVSKITSVDLTTGKEKTIHHPGYITERLSSTEDYIYWTQYSSHPRWEYLNYSELWRYDIRKNSAQRLSLRTRYFNPIEIDNGYVALIENTNDGKNFITILEENGEKINSIPLPSTLEIKEICKDYSNGIIARCASPNGSVILHYRNLESIPDTILGPVFRDISNITVDKNHLYFTMTHQFKEEVFSLDLISNNIYRVSDTEYGISNFSISDKGSIVASVFVKNGSLPALIPNIKVPVLDTFIFEPNEPLYSSNNKPKDFIGDCEVKTIQSSKYSHIRNLFNIHSWATVYFNPLDIISGNNYSIYPGVTVVSQNLTSSLVSSFGYSYNQTHGFHAHAEWMGWFPKISLGVDVGNKYAILSGGPLATDSVIFQNKPLVKTSGRIRVPYMISSGYLLSEINIGVKFSQENTATWNYIEESYTENLFGIEPYLSLYLLTRMAHRDLRPKFGIYLYSGELSSPTQGSVFGTSFVALGGVYLPGLFSNHSILVNGQWEHQKTQQYIRSPRLIFPRGHPSMLYESAFTSSFNYSLPIAYPDLPVGPILYLKRFFSNFFFDSALVNKYSRTSQGMIVEKETLSSTGLEVNADINLFRTPYNYRLGYRVGINLETNQYSHSFIFSFDLSSIYGLSSKEVFYNINL